MSLRLLTGSALVLLLLTGADGSATLDVLSLLREFGFPIFVCLWFMWRLEKRIDKFTASIERLYQINMVLAKAVDDLDEGPSPLPPAPTGPTLTGV